MRASTAKLNCRPHSIAKSRSLLHSRIAQSTRRKNADMCVGQRLHKGRYLVLWVPSLRSMLRFPESTSVGIWSVVRFACGSRCRSFRLAICFSLVKWVQHPETILPFHRLGIRFIQQCAALVDRRIQRAGRLRGGSACPATGRATEAPTRSASTNGHASREYRCVACERFFGPAFTLTGAVG